MSKKVFEDFQKIINEFYKGAGPASVIELGAYHWSLLSMEKFNNSRKVAFNFSYTENDKKKLEKYEVIEGNINSMTFKDEEFDCAMSCSTFEHDKYFWKSIAETRRILKKGGLFVVGVPVYTELATDMMTSTLTYKVHGKSYNMDFYRFSEQAVREVLLEGFEVVSVVYSRKYPNPYLLMAGVKK
jgi:SAM-dependent methyltransferase